MAKFRKKMSRQASERYFTKTASRTHYKNIQRVPMRGGIRM